MHTFRDGAGRDWSLTITVSAVKRVRGTLDVDLYSLFDDQFAGLSLLLADPVKLVDVVYVLCREQADRVPLTDEQFGEGMHGDGLGNAADALVGELIAFFPDREARAGLAKAVEKMRVLRSILIRKGLETLDAIDPESEAEKLNASSGSLPDSSGSTPDHLRITKLA